MSPKKIVLVISLLVLASCGQRDLNKAQTTETLSDNAYTWLLKLSMMLDDTTLFSINYHEGYNLNFEISEQQARSVLPDNLTPMALKLLESDPEPLYYLSWYLAVMGSDDGGMAIKRIDLFTYARDQNDDLALYFLSSFIEVPPFIENNAFAFNQYKEMLEFFARDSQTGGVAYPHYYTDTLTADHDTFQVVYEQSRIESLPCSPLTKNELFSRDFVAANSQIYRTAVDKNVNYFNQSFLNAKVETRDPACLKHENLTGFDPMLKDLRSIHFYGSSDKKITWYFEM